MADTFLIYRIVDDLLILTPSGDPNHIWYEDLRNQYNDVRRCVEQPQVRHLVVDCSQLRRIESHLVGIVLQLGSVVERKGGETVLCAVRDTVRETLQTLLLLDRRSSPVRWRTCDNLEAAVSILRELQRMPTEQIHPTIATERGNPSRRMTIVASQHWGPVRNESTAESPDVIHYEHLILDVNDRWMVVTESRSRESADSPQSVFEFVSDHEAEDWLEHNGFLGGVTS